jgi:catechol 2,3-dioxygenase-like lactoylglutathione lyase family enzyme
VINLKGAPRTNAGASNRGEAIMPTQIIDHVQVAVSDYARAKAFYQRALEPLGFTLMMEFPEGQEARFGGFGTRGKPYLWVGGTGRPTPTGHVAFGARSEDEVNAFYQAAMDAGGTDNGPPGIRADYHPKYYAAYVRDPDGNNIEAVWQGQEEMPEPAPARRRAPTRKRAAAAKKPATRRAAAAKKPAPRTAGKTAAKRTPPKKPSGRGGRGGGAGGRSGGGRTGRR